MGARYGFVSTFPPTQCGLATFAAALRGALLRSGPDEGWVVRLVDSPMPSSGEEGDGVVAQLVAGRPDSLSRSVTQLNQCDVVILQHEYGIYGGYDGSEILSLLDQVRVPSIVVLHTVLTDPTVRQREILEAVAAKADAVVTMTAAARDRLAGYAVDLAKVCIIAHGAPAMPKAEPIARPAHPTLLTWGLLGPGKGIEWGIEAMALLRDLRPMPHYVIAGQTHPKVLLRQGEIYRDRLRAQVRHAQLGPWVRFDGRYRGAVALAELVQAADVVLLPYDSTDQVTSGVLIEAVAAGKPVVATQFPHARELLAGGAGLVVPHRDPAAIAAALRSVLTRGEVLAAMASAAAATAPGLLWPAVAGQYRELAARLIGASVAA
ncbi:MAG TPA: glycosyltransferase [Streptosporangiaceae bacterium]